MKLVTYDDGRVGNVDGDRVVALDVPDMRTYFERGGQAEATGAEHPLERRRAARADHPARSSSTPPATSASTTRSRSGSTGRTVLPWIVFFQNVDAIIGPDEPIIYPEALTNELDYELELAVVIGKAGKFFSPEEAADYIAGYMIFNDITARDIQREEMRSGVFCLCKASTPSARSARGSSPPTRSPIRTTWRWSCASTASRARSRTRAGCR